MQSRETLQQEIGQGLQDCRQRLQQIIDHPEDADGVQREAAKAFKELHGVQSSINRLLGIAEGGTS